MKVELCNAGHFPVFTVDLPYDPEAHTSPYFNKLHADLAEANGFWSYALVDLSDDVIITATIRRPDHVLTLSYEKFRALR